MTDEEKIAKWAGFREKTFRAPVCTHKPRCTYWVDPNGKDTRHLSDPNGKRLPDFTSLDVLFKWCVPKLRVYTLTSHAFTYHKAEVWFGGSLLPGVGRKQSPGEALREAILALIGEGDVQPA